MEIQATQAAVTVLATAGEVTSLPAATAVAPATTASAETKVPVAVEGAAVASSLNQAAKLNSTALEFSVDDATHSQVVVVRDSDTGDVIFQYPSEEALRMIRNLEAGVGGLVDKLV